MVTLYFHFPFICSEAQATDKQAGISCISSWLLRPRRSTETLMTTEKLLFSVSRLYLVVIITLPKPRSHTLFTACDCVSILLIHKFTLRLDTEGQPTHQNASGSKSKAEQAKLFRELTWCDAAVAGRCKGHAVPI